MERTSAQPKVLLKQWLPPVLALLWFGACQLYFRWPLTGGIAAIVILVAFPFVVRWLNHFWPNTWSTVGAVTIVMTTSIAVASFMTSSVTRQLTTFASSGLLIVLLQSSAALPVVGLPGRLTLFTMTVSYWFGWLAILNINIFLNWSIWILALLAAALTTAVAIVVWYDGGVSSEQIRRAWWFAAVLGLEFFIAIWALPTSILVGSVIATTAVMLWLQICRHTWLKTWQADRGRRYVTVGTIVIATVLLTARWI